MSKKKKKISFGAIATVFFAIGAYCIQQGKTTAGIIVAILGAIVLLMAKYAED